LGILSGMAKEFEHYEDHEDLEDVKQEFEGFTIQKYARTNSNDLLMWFDDPATIAFINTLEEMLQENIEICMDTEPITLEDERKRNLAQMLYQGRKLLIRFLSVLKEDTETYIKTKNQ